MGKKERNHVKRARERSGDKANLSCRISPSYRDLSSAGQVRMIDYRESESTHITHRERERERAGNPTHTHSQHLTFIFTPAHLPNHKQIIISSV